MSHVDKKFPQSTYFSRFLPTLDFGGGSRRMMQVWEILQCLGCELVSSARGDRLDTAVWQRIKKAIKTQADPGCRLWSRQRREAVIRLGEVARTWGQAIDTFSNLDLVFMDDPIYFLPLFEALEKRHKPVVAICHNLETLASSQVEKGASKELFVKELDVLSRCRLVITISREETWLLDNLHIPSFYLPYYPLKPVLSRLLAVRREREKLSTSSRSGILMLGNAINLSTLEGMNRVIQVWQEKHLDRLAGQLLVAGYNADKMFKPDSFPDSIRFLGTLTNEELDRRLVQVKACLCFQESGTGALTRICEMLIAHVPVLANSHAARSYYHIPGVTEFAGLNHLEEVIEKIDRIGGNIPLPTPPNARELIAQVKRIL